MVMMIALLAVVVGGPPAAQTMTMMGWDGIYIAYFYFKLRELLLCVFPALM